MRYTAAEASMVRTDSRAGNVLLVYPRFPSTYWGLQYALPVLGKKSYMPPLGLITIAAMLPPSFDVRLVDLNCESLTDADIDWADAVFLSAMISQRRSLFEVAARCRQAGKLIVMGGPFPTGSPDECAPWADTIVTGEAEAVWDDFLEDLTAGRLQPRYGTDIKPDVRRTPIPRFDLLKVDSYLTIPIQYSRGCPFRCEFCDIIVMFGRRPRTKTPEQIVQELDAVRHTGFRGEIFIVDDNFIGNRKEVSKLLPALKAWNDRQGRPFDFGTEASVDLAQYDDLMADMVGAGFRWVFFGIETPSKESLKETLKFQNLKDPLDAAVGRVFAAGLHVSGGFIIGFDSDKEDIFDRQIAFISRAGIPFATVGLLVALEGTPLHQRMRASGRLIESSAEMQADQCGYTNIRTVIPRETLLKGYQRVMTTLYAPDRYFARCFQAVVQLKRSPTLYGRAVTLGRGLRREMWRILGRGGRGRARRALSTVRRSWQFVVSMPAGFRTSAARFAWHVLRARPDQLDAALELIVFGYHLHRFTFECVLPEVETRISAISAGDGAPRFEPSRAS